MQYTVLFGADSRVHTLLLDAHSRMHNVFGAHSRVHILLLGADSRIHNVFGALHIVECTMFLVHIVKCTMFFLCT